MSKKYGKWRRPGPLEDISPYADIRYGKSGELEIREEIKRAGIKQSGYRPTAGEPFTAKASKKKESREVRPQKREDRLKELQAKSKEMVEKRAGRFDAEARHRELIEGRKAQRKRENRLKGLQAKSKEMVEKRAGRFDAEARQRELVEGRKRERELVEKKKAKYKARREKAKRVREETAEARAAAAEVSKKAEAEKKRKRTEADRMREALEQAKVYKQRNDSEDKAAAAVKAIAAEFKGKNPRKHQKIAVDYIKSAGEKRVKDLDKDPKADWRMAKEMGEHRAYGFYEKALQKMNKELRNISNRGRLRGISSTVIGQNIAGSLGAFGGAVAADMPGLLSSSSPTERFGNMLSGGIGAAANVAGAGIGWAMGGPVGAMIGQAVGEAVSKISAAIIQAVFEDEKQVEKSTQQEIETIMIEAQKTGLSISNLPGQEQDSQLRALIRAIKRRVTVDVEDAIMVNNMIKKIDEGLQETFAGDEEAIVSTSLGPF